MSRCSRRDFLKRTAVGGMAAAGLSLVGTKASARIIGANDTVRVALAGINARGTEHIKALAKIATEKNVELVYLVDPDTRLFPEKSELVNRLMGDTPTCVQDLRKALDDPNLDAVFIAAPNHWHTLLAIWACKAGKDVYVEKPCGHTIVEGRKLVEAARKYDRIVQNGTQSRSDAKFIDETAAVRSGKYGKLLIAYAYAGKPRKGIGFKEPKAPPEGLDFNFWLGPAPEQPYNDNLVPYNWHWFWDFGNGEIGNQGPHQCDIARWGMPEGAQPKSVISLGGRFVWNDQGQTANTQFTVIDFGGPKLFMENRDLVKAVYPNTRNEFYTEDGVIRDGKFFPKGEEEGEPIPGIRRTKDYLNEHFANFIDCVRSHKREDLNSEILEGHLSARLSHMGNISYRLGTEVPFSEKPTAFGDDQPAYDAFDRMKEYLADEVGMKLDDATYRLGRKLAFDAQTEKFVGDDDANKLLTKTYREPFALPE
jgi:predicted dehydrogenase